jgi:tRNA dimethylallyltransferase
MYHRAENVGDSVLVILGPTSVGKTQLSLKLADILKGEIVSFDSRQIYKLMDVGTAKPTEEERRHVPHHLIDVVYPNEKFTAADYGKQARKVIQEITKRGRTPVAVGGSGLYLRALIQGFFEGPKADEDIRGKLEREAQELGGPHLFNRLKQVDPLAAEKIHPHDSVRIIRALEVYELTGRPISTWQREGSYERFPVRFVKIGLNMDRARLYERIDLRIESMVSAGLLDEVRTLKEKGYTPKLKALKTVGYQELFDHLEGRLELKEAIDRIKLNTRHYAKRQLTWFRKEQNVTWLDADDRDLAERIVGLFGSG